MTLEQITGENLFEVESGLSRLSSQDPDAILKFVLLESPDGRGFIRIDKGPEHVNTLGRLNRYLSDQGESPSTFTKHGGGWVNIYRHNTTKPWLRFYGRSSVLGAFDKKLLKKTLAEALDKEKFEYAL